MSLSAKIIFVSPIGETREVVVEFSDGISKPFTVRYQTDGTTESLQPQVRQTVARLSSRKVSDLSEGAVIDTTPLPQAVDVGPTPEQQARTQFIILYGRAKSLQRGVALGVLSADDKSVIDAQADARAAYRSDFEDAL